LLNYATIKEADVGKILTMIFKVMFLPWTIFAKILGLIFSPLTNDPVLKKAKEKAKKSESELHKFLKKAEELKEIEDASREEEEDKKFAKLDEAEAKRKKKLIDKYGDEIGSKIASGKIWIDMTKEMLIDSWGKPEDTTEDVSRNKTKLRWYYKGRVTRQATTVYKYEVKLENDLVEGWKELE